MKFEVRDGIVVSDPCYNGETLGYCSATFDKVVPGMWSGKAIMSDEGAWGMRCKELVAFAPSTFSSLVYWLMSEHEICVDSGQAGIFDKQDFLDHQHERDYGTDDWYSKMCDLSYDEKRGLRAGSYEYGVNASSGYGDGSYSLYYATDNDGRVCALKIVFISENEDDDYEGGDEYEDN